ncbi:unnamed protein product [Diatraea saccharalis]|uniref:DUF4776 domain-containing protein n=1 Tax=Diatraea saccharalis TaxID=40085 RepID=A0A9N9WB70_9NEOP|nr:unnamed protein product [Diatraea saccharalis]
MAVTNAMFLFEVVIEHVKSLVESRFLVIRSEFGDIFSLELKDPKQMYIVIPDPPPLPPEPAGKKGKKKPPKPKKGKKGKVELPPPEPVIQSGQSVLFTSSPEFLIQNMKKFPLEMSLWSKEDNLTYIGSNSIPWDQKFLGYLEQICSCQEPLPVTLNDEYNIFEEGTAKLMAKIGLQVKLTYLTDRVTTAFRTLSEDPVVKKVLYTGINSKTTSYMCTLKTTDEVFEENCNKVENKFIKDKPKAGKIVYADYKNAPGANLTFFNEGDYCCMGNADKPPKSIYKSPETCPDIDHIVDYVRKIIVSCNDNMRMLTPRPTISPRVKATDIDRLCYCKETKWPSGEFAERFKKEAQADPCPICINAGKRPHNNRPCVFDIANIRGPCGRHDCRIARTMKAYIENLVEEDNQEFSINDIIGPCGSKVCTLAEKIQEFLRHEGVFSHSETLEGLSTQCACLKTMQDALTKKSSCSSVCSKDCNEAESDDSQCGGNSCPFGQNKQVYNIYYFTVEHDFDKDPKTDSTAPSAQTSKYQFCSNECPSVKASENTSCSKTACPSPFTSKTESGHPDDSTCAQKVCASENYNEPSPTDSEVVIPFDAIHNPCCVKSCDVTERVKDFIAENILSRKDKVQTDDPCYCDCVCTFKFSRKTTYCAVCGGYECLGDDMKDQPVYAKPHPCPVYNKLYDKKYIKTPNPWPEEEQKQADTVSMKSSRTVGSRAGANEKRTTSVKSLPIEKKDQTECNKKTKPKQEKKKVGKFTANAVEEPLPPVEKKPETKYPYPAVPRNMGWNWVAEDIPGMKPRPKWKPGAANKILVRRYRAVREGIDIIAKKKRALLQRKKKIEMKPTLVVQKQGGEYTVQMEVFKKFSKERLVYQYPYDEKPPLVYTIGRSAEENLKRKKAKERKERRETRRKSRLLQSTFRDKCQEICLKAYNQAIGLLPLPNPNDPNCPCYTEPNPALSPPIDSCSCSEEGSLSSSDTDDDEWTIEFTPPAARWDAKAKHPPVHVETETQYTYLDYKVKLLDKSGNQVPRFFKGPDGKQECSDLGGFWGPGHEWLEINKDGYIGPDNRWVPQNFIGPDGMFYSSEDGFITDASGQVLKIGVDGYIDKDGKWAWYSRTKKISKSAKSTVSGSTAGKRSPRSGRETPVNAQTTPKGVLSPKGKKPQQISGKRSPPKTTFKGNNQVVMSLATNHNQNMVPSLRAREKKNMINLKNMERYLEIMNEMQMYDDQYELKYPLKTNRASNTPSKKISPFTIDGNHVKNAIMGATVSFINTDTTTSSILRK